ncbi:MAG TPA: hypothetical protein VLV78_15890 [Thermoanaerobaculia bacterium]|nr:hypothetical protein [Thermoanaerobaculia bacterium]
MGDLLHAAWGHEPDYKPWRGERSASVQPFSRGAVALAAAAETIARVHNVPRVEAWLPDFMCNDALDWLRAAANVRFYRVRPSLEPEWEDLSGHQGALVIVHYFGFPNPAVTQDRALPDFVVIEDAAHVLAPVSPIGAAPIAIYSPRKLLSVPPIGCIAVAPALASAIPQAGRGGEGEAAMWIARRLVQKALRMSGISWHWLWRNRHAPAEADRIANDAALTAPTAFARRMLAVESRRLDQTRTLRRRNYQLLADFVDRAPGLAPLFDHLPDGVCPYAFPLRALGGAQPVVQSLQSMGIPASRWADLPPEVRHGNEKHRVAIELAREIVLLPVHQGLSLREVERIGSALVRAAS